jgi:steroid delta-isomerase-like uncharacterized protein
MAFDAQIAMVERFVEEAFVNFRADEMEYLLAPGFRCHAWRRLGIVDGPEGARQLIERLKAAFSETSAQIEDVVASGDRVAVRYVFEGQHSGEMLGIPASGKRVRVSGIFIARFDGGRIAELWPEHDVLSMLRQMGALAAAA